MMRLTMLMYPGRGSGTPRVRELGDFAAAS
jgi:hypothetical protein